MESIAASKRKTNIFNPTRFCKYKRSIMSYTKTYNIPAIKRGDTWKGMRINFTGQNITGWAVTMMVKPVNSDEITAQYSTATGNPTITNAAAGEVTWAAQVINWPPGLYKYDIQFVKANGERRTYLAGTWQVTDDVTKP